MTNPFANPAAAPKRLNSSLQTFPSPGWDGMPFRGESIPDIKHDDVKQPEEVWDAKVCIFDLANPEHLAEYERIWDMIAKGLFFHSMEEREYDPVARNWRVLLRYGIRYAEMPGSVQKRLKVDANSIRISN